MCSQLLGGCVPGGCVPWRVCSLLGVFSVAWWVCSPMGLFPWAYFPWFRFYLQPLMELIQVDGFC